jgi:hypothetical protein
LSTGRKSFRSSRYTYWKDFLPAVEVHVPCRMENLVQSMRFLSFSQEIHLIRLSSHSKSEYCSLRSMTKSVFVS